jgi:hypothetical protein
VLANYRRAVLLGEGERLAQQWKEKGKGPTAASEREELRSRLLLACPELKGASQECSQRRGVEVVDEVLAKIQRSLFRHEDESLTRCAVRLSKKCVCMRLDGRDAISSDRLDTAFEKTVDEIRRTSRLLGRIAWAERYNAASLYALGPRFGTPDDDESRRLCELAVNELGLAVQRANSRYVASRREWLLSEDPDLDLLRSAPNFKAFEATYFPPVKSLLTRPSNVHQLEAVEYVRRLLSACADRRAKLWRDRVDQRARRHPDWWTEDDDAWELVGAVATDCHRWQTRLDFIRGDQRLDGRVRVARRAPRLPRVRRPSLGRFVPDRGSRDASRRCGRECSQCGRGRRAPIGSAAWGALSERLSRPRR